MWVMDRPLGAALAHVARENLQVTTAFGAAPTFGDGPARRSRHASPRRPPNGRGAACRCAGANISRVAMQSVALQRICPRLSHAPERPPNRTLTAVGIFPNFWVGGCRFIADQLDEQLRLASE
jgi:hypothetical protein